MTNVTEYSEAEVNDAFAFIVGLYNVQGGICVCLKCGAALFTDYKEVKFLKLHMKYHEGELL